MKQCNQCHRPLPTDAVGGICPACLLGLARRPVVETDHDVTRGHGKTAGEDYPSPAELGRLLPQYRVESQIGQGGMGAVYRAYQPSLERSVAIKIMAPRFAHDPSFAERFAREARTMARLNHQNIVNVYDYGQAGSLCYLVMEFVDGVNLRWAMREGDMTAQQAVAIVPQVCEALQFAHDEGIVHRDIKPENILVDRKGRVKIADFGLAKLVASDDPQQWTLTGSRQILGTANYMAPEQIERPTSVDHRADIYSLGVVLYELLTGELPLGRFQLPGEKHAGHAALDDVVKRTLEKAPERRYQQASEVKSAVETAKNSTAFQSEIAAARATLQTVPNSTEPKPGTTHHADQNSDLKNSRVQFSIENPWHGLTVTHGVMKASPDGLQIEYSKRENVFNNPLGNMGQHRFPYHSILKADLNEGWYSHSIVLSLDSPMDYDGLWCEKPGQLKLAIAFDDVDQARVVVNSIRAWIGQPLIPVRAEKPADSRARVQRRLRWPAIGLVIAGAINLLVLPLMLLLPRTVEFWTSTSFARKWEMKLSKVVESQTAAEATRADAGTATAVANQTKTASSQLESAAIQSKAEISQPPAVVSPPAPASPAPASPAADPNHATTQEIHITADANPSRASEGRSEPGRLSWLFVPVALWMPLGSLMIAAAVLMLNLRHWGWCLAVAIVAVIPLHPGVLFGLPFGIMALIELVRPGHRAQFE